MKNKRMLASFATFIALAGGSSLAQAEDTVRIAIAGPVTGPVAQYGDMQLTGARVAIEQINQSGGVNGKQLEAVIYDDACDPEQAVEVANKIAKAGIRFVVGHLCSSSTLPAAAIYEEESILMITPASASPDITRSGNNMIFRTIGLDSLQGPVAGQYIVEKINPRKVAVLHDTRQYSEAIAREVKNTVQAGGVEIVVFEGISAGYGDYSALIDRLNRQGVELVYYGGYHQELGKILRLSKERGFKARFMGPEGVGNSDLSAIAGQAAEGLLVTLPVHFDQDPENAGLVAEIKAMGKDASGPFVFPAYSAVKVIVDSMTIAKNEDPETVAETLRRHSFKTPTGILNFDNRGDLKEFGFVVYEWHSDSTKTAME